MDRNVIIVIQTLNLLSVGFLFYSAAVSPHTGPLMVGNALFFRLGTINVA